MIDLTAEDFEVIEALSKDVQARLSGHTTTAVAASLTLMMADIAVNLCDTPDSGCAFIDWMADFSKQKLRNDFDEGKEALSVLARRQASRAGREGGSDGR